MTNKGRLQCLFETKELITRPRGSGSDRHVAKQKKEEFKSNKWGRGQKNQKNTSFFLRKFETNIDTETSCRHVDSEMVHLKFNLYDAIISSLFSKI